MRATISVQQRSTNGLSWLKLLGLASTVELLLLIAAGVFLQDTEALVFAAVVGVASVWFLLRPGVVPAVIRCLVFLDVLFWMAPAAATNASDHENLVAILMPLALAVTSATGIAATVGYVLRRDDPNASSRAAIAVLVAAGVVFLAAVAAAATSSANPPQAGTRDIQLTAQGVRFSSTALRAPAGQVSVYISNEDLFWHTFTIKQLGVSTPVPVKGHRRATFTATRGKYVFYCAIPGHAAAGMKGTLTIR
jgi:plastocyanin